MDSEYVSVESPSEWVTREIGDMLSVKFNGNRVAEFIQEYLRDQNLPTCTVHDALLVKNNDKLVYLKDLSRGDQFVFQSVDDVFTVYTYPCYVNCNKIPCKDRSDYIYYFDPLSLVIQT